MIKDFIYKLLYKNTGQQVMGALTNCEAYQINKKSNDSLNKKIKENAHNLQDQIEKNINNDSSNGKFKTKTYYQSKDYSKQDIKYIKQLYKQKGYKVKVYLDYITYSGRNRRITISWKHWNKKY